MDGSRFDALARLAGDVSTRRTAFRAALAGLTVSGLTATQFIIPLGDVAARKTKRKKCKKCKALALGAPCTSHKQCCANETNRACQVQLGAGNSDRTCCGVLNAPCGMPEDCCQQYDCQGGRCQPSPPF